jgi:D-sedoheptulose 7-phosphate isomerase
LSFKSYVLAASRLMEETSRHVQDAHVEKAVATVATALTAKKAFLVCGNGGSASDAMHITGELVGRFLKERRALKAICLSSNPAVLTAWANDYSYDTIFSRQVEAFGEPGGVILGLSTSGNSKNVILAFEEAKKLGMTTIAMTGAGGGKLAALSDILLDVPSRSTPDIQQVHICLYHYLCQEVEARCAV